MHQATAQLGQLFTIIVMAIALGMDAFSLSVGIGMRGVRRTEMARISGMIALFHILMPLLGMVAGLYVGQLLGEIARFFSGGLLLLLGAHMIYASFQEETVRSFDHRKLLGMLLFSLSVSVDSFSVGVSLGMFHSSLLLTVLAFGLFGGIMSLSGMWLGRRVSHNLGDYGEAIGGAILFGFGLLFIF